MKTNIACVLLAVGFTIAYGQNDKAGPTFTVKDSDIRSPLTFVLYGDQRFMDPATNSQSSPTMRQLLVKQIAKERPAAVIMNGDVPNNGLSKNDYVVYKAETKVWQDEGLLVIAAIGNHEMIGDEKEALENWWNAFPKYRGLRWYSTQLGARVYIITLDSMSSLLPGSEQARWLAKQIDGMGSTIDFLVITLHHPPVADVQTHILVDHNPRRNEMALRDYLDEKAKNIHARILVSAGHVHNYERHEEAGITYLVSGGGGAFPYIVERTPDDLYKDPAFPIYHYVKCTLEGPVLKSVMYRAAEPENPNSTFDVKDQFEIVAKAHRAVAAAE